MSVEDEAQDEVSQSEQSEPEIDYVAELAKLKLEEQESARKEVERLKAAKSRQVPVDAQRGSRDVYPREPDVDRQLGEVASAFAPGVQRLLREQANQGKYKIDHAQMKVR